MSQRTAVRLSRWPVLLMALTGDILGLLVLLLLEGTAGLLLAGVLIAASSALGGLWLAALLVVTDAARRTWAKRRPEPEPDLDGDEGGQG